MCAQSLSHVADFATAVATQEANPSGIVHYSAVCIGCEPYPIALCGASLRDEDANHEPLDCLVCGELGSEGFRCAKCGDWIG